MRLGCPSEFLTILHQLHEGQQGQVKSIFLQVQLCWAAHVTSMEDVGMPTAVFVSELQAGKHYKDQLNRQLA